MHTELKLKIAQVKKLAQEMGVPESVVAQMMEAEERKKRLAELDSIIASLKPVIDSILHSAAFGIVNEPDAPPTDTAADASGGAEVPPKKKPGKKVTI